MKYTPNKDLTHACETLLLQDWAKRTGTPVDTLRRRLDRGWTIERALTTTPRNYEDQIEVNDTVRGLKDWLAIIGISHQALYESARNHKITTAEEISRRLKENPPNKEN